MRWGVILFLLALVVLWQIFKLLPFPSPHNLAPASPLQTALTRDDKPWSLRTYKIVPLAHYDITARIMHRESYWLDHEAAVSPVDFALGWGVMSNPNVYGKLHIGQGSRWYSWHWWGDPPIGENEIHRLSANTHIIPADSAVGAKLDDLRTDDVVHLTGYLVEVDGTDGWHWTSSLSRDDTGSGSCELMWVNQASKVGR